MIFCTFLHILTKFAPFQQYTSLNRTKVPFTGLPRPPPPALWKIHGKDIFHRYLYTCRKIFAFSREISREVYFWRIFEENGKIVVLGILGIKREKNCTFWRALVPPTIFFIFLYIVYLVISYIIHLASLPQKFLYSVGGTSKSTTSIIFCTFLHILKKFAPFQQYPSLNRIKVPFMDLPPPPPLPHSKNTWKIHISQVFIHLQKDFCIFQRNIERSLLLEDFRRKWENRGPGDSCH